MSSIQLECLPETIGLLQNLKILNVSGNLLTALLAELLVFIATTLCYIGSFFITYSYFGFPGL